VPVYVKYPALSKNSSLAMIDWSQSFVLNSRLQKYTITMDDSSTVYTGVVSHHGIERVNPQDSKNMFRIIDYLKILNWTEISGLD